MRLLGIGAASWLLVGCLAISCVASRALASPPAATGLELGARVAGQASDQGLGLLAGVQADWRAISMIALGVYGDFTPIYSRIQPKCGCSEPRGRPARLGALAELHVLPSGVADPFLRAGLGLLHTHRDSLDSELGLGLDLRAGPFAFGPFGTWIMTFSRDQPKHWLLLGGRVVLAL
jgi:hypothetical protein